MSRSVTVVPMGSALHLVVGEAVMELRKWNHLERMEWSWAKTGTGNGAHYRDCSSPSNHCINKKAGACLGILVNQNRPTSRGNQVQGAGGG